MANILVIGASRGIGLEFVRQYRAAGARVTATARDSAGLARLAALGAETIELDVSKSASIAGMEWRLENERFDIALYVAGVYSHDRATAPVTTEEFDQVMHANVLGAMQLIPTVAPKVAAAKGKFVFISSLLGSISEAGDSRNWLYRVSKAGLNMAARAAEQDYPGTQFVLISPGWVKTDMGGPAAALEVTESVAGMRSVIAGKPAIDANGFVNYKGERIRW
jgi:NAD(P)-dependent dehydrogenase (short-subunit alcohol dehydrogenase family)